MQQDKWDRLEYEAMLSPESRAADRINNDMQARLLLEYMEAMRRADNALLGLEMAMAAGAGMAGAGTEPGPPASIAPDMHPDTPGTLKSNPRASED